MAIEHVHPYARPAREKATDILCDSAIDQYDGSFLLGEEAKGSQNAVRTKVGLFGPVDIARRTASSCNISSA